ncbi:(2Fe-2S)-binding protein [Methylocella sp.]|uniref:(2Fe-2S)-binding protein n=1 Tax=Methylocella sp. TaxID=1978226 RepID=UPI0037834018
MIAPDVTLLDLLRERLTGTKKGCDHGRCGACAVLAIMQEGADVVTVEGLGAPGRLRPMQRAFIARDAFQRGYCTPGQICSAVGLLNEGRARTDDEIREGMSGNLRRCGAYPNILAAIRDVLAESEAAGEAAQ